MAYSDQIIEIKTNKLPKGLTLENLFDSDNAKLDKRKFMADKSDYSELEVGNGWKLKVRNDVTQGEKD